VVPGTAVICQGERWAAPSALRSATLRNRRMLMPAAAAASANSTNCRREAA
jgi:hypothetical protein